MLPLFIANAEAGKIYAQSVFLFELIFMKISAGKDTASIGQLVQQAFSLLQAGRVEGAILLFDKILLAQPDNIDALNGRAFIYFERKDWMEAKKLIEKLISLASNDPVLHMRMGLIHVETKHFQDACVSFRAAVQLKPGFAEAHYKLGTTLMAMGNSQAAVDAFRTAIRFKPGFAESYSDLGHALWKLGDKTAARSNFGHAIRLKPDHVEALNSLGVLLRDEKDFEKAEHYLRLSVKYKPDLADTRSNLGLTLALAQKIDEALNEFREAIRLAPDQGNHYCNLGRSLMLQGKFTEAESNFRESIVHSPHLILTYNNLFYLLLLSGDKHAMFELFGKFQHMFEEKHQEKPRVNSRVWDKHRRLRIGYISADFRAHPVGLFFEPIINHHNKEVVEIFCYYNDDTIDLQTNLIRNGADHWRDCLNLDDDRLAAYIVDDKIDILIDLTGHFTGQRLEVLARKPAPIQMHYLGYPGSLGLKSVDYRITDAYTDPDGAEDAYIEKLLRLPGSLWCYHPRPDFPEIKQLPAIANGYITFASLNNYNKLDAQTISMWADLLHAIPDAKLALVTIPEGEARKDLLGKFEKVGILTHRLKLVGPLPSDQFLEFIQEVDIALDPVLVQGATTTCEVLWSGVPTISLVGNSYASRAGLSILSAAGYPELVFTSREAFIAGGKALALDTGRLVRYRQTMRMQVDKSSLCDAARFTQNLELLYRKAWHVLCDENKLIAT